MALGDLPGAAMASDLVGVACVGGIGVSVGSSLGRLTGPGAETVKSGFGGSIGGDKIGMLPAVLPTGFGDEGRRADLRGGDKSRLGGNGVVDRRWTDCLPSSLSGDPAAGTFLALPVRETGRGRSSFSCPFTCILGKTTGSALTIDVPGALGRDPARGSVWLFGAFGISGIVGGLS